MARLTVALIVLTSLALVCPHAQNAAEIQPPPIIVDVVAVDRNGSPVRDLTPDEIEVWIGHFRAPIQKFHSVADQQAGRSVVLLLDDLTISPVLVPKAREAARAFLSRMKPHDRVVVATLSGTSTEGAADAPEVRSALDKYNAKASGPLRLDVVADQVLEALARLAPQPETTGGRNTIVAIGPGALFDRPLPPPESGFDLEPHWVDMLRALAFARTHLYVIDPSGVGSGPADGGQYGLARATGGRAFLNTNDLGAAADRILRDASNYYVITVPDPPIGRKSDVRELEVRVHRRGVTALARRLIPGIS